jgi:hypothetical protein
MGSAQLCMPNLPQRAAVATRPTLPDRPVLVVLRKSELEIDPIPRDHVILLVFPGPVRTFPSPGLAKDCPFAVDRPPGNDGRWTLVPQGFVHEHATVPLN